VVADVHIGDGDGDDDGDDDLKMLEL